jgi:hypothetical protein
VSAQRLDECLDGFQAALVRAAAPAAQVFGGGVRLLVLPEKAERLFPVIGPDGLEAALVDDLLEPFALFVGQVVRALQEAKSEKDYSGNTEAEIQRIIYYQYSGSSTYDVYLDMKLEVSKLDKAGKYSFKRSTIGVAAPVDFEFNNIQFSGTIIKLSERPLPREQYTVKTVTLTKRNAFPWEYDAIRVGDIAHNGEVGVLEVLGKDSIDTATITQDAYGNLVPAANTPGKYITVVMKMKGKMVNDTFVFGEEQVIAPGKDLSLDTRNFIFSNFVVTKVE